MTSFPPRIEFVKLSFISIIKQKIDPTLYHCVLVLSNSAWFWLIYFVRFS
jgi:hypothetical protein